MCSVCDFSGLGSYYVSLVCYVVARCKAEVEWRKSFRIPFFCIALEQLQVLGLLQDFFFK